MAISNNPALKNSANPNPAPAATHANAPIPAPAPKPTAGGATGKSNPDVEAFRAMGREFRAGMSDDMKAAEGSKANTLAFVAALGDPRQRQDRVANNASLESYLVVGFRFRAIEPVTYEKIPLKTGARDIIDVDYDAHTPVTVQAGEEFDLNLMEMARLLADPLYAGSATGGEKGVYLTFKDSKARKDMLPVLSCIGKGSVKEGMILIGQKVDDNTWAAKPEFAEKFGVLYTKKAAVRKGSAAAKDPNNTRKEVAASFYSFFLKKMSGEPEAQAQQ